MKILLTDNEILNKINDYPEHNWIWVEIWEMSEYEIQVVITVNKQEMCHLADHIVIHACSAQTDEGNDIAELKMYGRLIARLIRRKFPESVVHSRLYYR